MDSTSDRVVIGMDPHKRSATIEVMAGDETIIGAGAISLTRGVAGREKAGALKVGSARQPSRD